MVIYDTSVTTIAPIVFANLEAEARLHTDQAKLYRNIGRQFAAHETVDHGLGE